MSSRTQVYLFAIVLTLMSAGFMVYKSWVLGFPLLPGENKKVWTLESKVTFEPTGGPVNVSLALPNPHSEWIILDEFFASSGFGFTVSEDDDQMRANWTRREVLGKPTLYYKFQIYRSNRGGKKPTPPVAVEPPELEENVEMAATNLIRQLEQRSAGPASFASLLLQEFRKDDPVQDAAFLLGAQDRSRIRVAQDVLALANIPARLVKGIYLEDGRRRQRITSLIEIYDGKNWVQFDPKTGKEGLPDNFFMWQRGGVSLIDVVGGRKSKVRFSIVENSLPARTVLLMEDQDERAALIDFSIYSLPVGQQGVFKRLLLVPIGALVVVFLRVIIGLKTSGTFMPILIALAFMQTTLLPGLLIFLLVVGVGLWIRYYLSHLNLLLVARVSAVVIVVVAIMAALSVISYKMGLDQALTVTFFPTIILAWTIERMSILWEEEGGHEVVVQGGGSLLASIAAYVVMTQGIVGHLMFNFPELILAVLAVILLMGQYSGYRLSELYRFRQMAGD